MKFFKDWFALLLISYICEFFFVVYWPLTFSLIWFLTFSNDLFGSVNNELDSTADTSNHEMQSAGLLHHSDGSSPEITQYSLEGFSLSVLPPDQMRMIGSINTLISEVIPLPLTMTTITLSVLCSSHIQYIIVLFPILVYTCYLRCAVISWFIIWMYSRMISCLWTMSIAVSTWERRVGTCSVSWINSKF